MKINCDIIIGFVSGSMTIVGLIVILVLVDYLNEKVGGGRIETKTKTNQ